MGYTQSSLAAPYNWGTKNSNTRKNLAYNTSGNITKITIHHMAGKMTAKACADYHHNGKSSSANYYVGYNGDICTGVEEGRRAWTSGSPDNDYKAITIEVSNDGREPDWHVSDAALNATIKLCIDICKRNDIRQIDFTGNKNGNLTMHCYFQSTACPGPYLKSKFQYIADEINKGLAGTAQEKPVQTQPAQPTPSAEIIHTVKSGETLGGIANKYNVKGGYEALAKYNNIKNPNKISVGQKIKIPTTSNTATTPAPAKTYPTGTTTARLNVRKGPGMNNGIIRVLEKGVKVTIYEEKSGWGRIGTGEWVCLDYVKKN